MFSNYFTIAWRNLTHNRIYSTINILGLALGMAVVLLIGAWINSELNYNSSFTKHSRIVLLMQNSTHSGHTDTRFAMPLPLATELRQHYAGDFRRVAVVTSGDDHILEPEGGQPITSMGVYAQPELSDIFTLKVIKGSRDLSEPSSMLISQSLAKILFADGEALGRTVKIDNKSSLRVTGVYEDIPENTDWKGMNFVMNWKFLEAGESWVREAATEWNSNNFTILAELAPNADLQLLNKKIKGTLEGHARNDKPTVALHPMDRWHLYGEFKDGINTGGAIRYIWMFGSIGIFVLLLACINFMNLSTARSERRAREVGIRKSIGSLRGQLIVQFLGESVLMAGLAAVLGLLMAKVSLPWFSQLAGSPIHLPLNAQFIGLWVGGTIIVGLLAGSYPALYLSSFNAVKVLKGTFRVGRAAAIPRKVLIVLQFTVSISLIIGTIVVFTQIAYVKNRPIGYEREGLLAIRMNTEDLSNHFTAIRDELQRGGAVVDVSQSSSRTTGSAWQQSGFSWEGKDPNVVPSLDVIFTTTGYGKTVGWQIVKGRDFSRDFATDSAGMVVNEAAVQLMGLKDPVGATVNYLYSSRKDNRYRIIGVVKDMVMRSPQEKVRPAVFMIDSSNAAWIMVKVDPAVSMATAMPRISAVFRKYNPGAPFDFQFASEDYARKFRSEEQVLRLAVFFTILAIFISCLGLFGLASFMAGRRMREIGVRKVLGASVPQLWGLMSKEFIRLVCIAWLIALPLSWYGMNKWLMGYDYRTGISGWIFLYTLAGALIITVVTVSAQGLRAAMTNPSTTLRTGE